MTDQVVTATSVGNPPVGTKISAVSGVAFKNLFFFVEMALLTFANSGNSRCIWLRFRLCFALAFCLSLGSGGGRSSVAAAVGKSTLVSPFKSSRSEESASGFLDPGGPRLLERDRGVFFDVSFPFAFAFVFGARLCSHWHSLPRGQTPVFQ